MSETLKNIEDLKPLGKWVHPHDIIWYCRVSDGKLAKTKELFRSVNNFSCLIGDFDENDKLLALEWVGLESMADWEILSILGEFI